MSALALSPEERRQCERRKPRYWVSKFSTGSVVIGEFNDKYAIRNRRQRERRDV
jgi:hypothetical protein